MQPGNLESILLEVHPGVWLPAEAADFVFNRLEYIRQGEEGTFEYDAPPPWELYDLCTLAFLIANQETVAAQDLVRNLARPPSILLPSATDTSFNDNYLKANPFRRRKKRRTTTVSLKSSQDAVASPETRSHFAKEELETENLPLTTECTSSPTLLEEVPRELQIKNLGQQQEYPGIRQSGWEGWGQGGLRGGTGGLVDVNLQGSGDGDEVGQPSDIDGEEEFLADCEFGDWTQFQASAHNAGAPVVSQDESENSGAYFLEKIDPDFVCGPRGIVRGEYSGVLNGTSYKLTARRKVGEGTWVDWSLVDEKTSKQVLMVRGEMSYLYSLSREARSSKHGVRVNGGWSWEGAGYGILNLDHIDERFPRDPRELHVDIWEALFYSEDVFHRYHLSGPLCRNINKSEDIVCREPGCGLRVWSIMFKTFTTFLEEHELRLPVTRKKEEVQSVFLSLVCFYNGDQKIALHQESHLKSYQEEVLWLSPLKTARFNDSLALVDRDRLNKAKLIKKTTVLRRSDVATNIEEVQEGVERDKIGSEELEREGSQSGERHRHDGDEEREAGEQHEERLRRDFQGGNGDELSNDPSGTHGHWRCEVCNISCSVARHLRSSKECLQQLKSQLLYRYKGDQDDELFVIRFSLLKGDCPSTNCVAGRHSDLPQPCLQWWKDIGYLKMGWRGDRVMADNNIIKEKIRNFVKNHQRKRTLESDCGTEASQTSQNLDDLLDELSRQTGGQCRSCEHVGDLIRHLGSSSQCRLAYVKNYLAGEELSARKSMFHLCAVLNVCGRVECAEEFTYLGPHLNSSDECLEFYRREGTHLALPNWSLTASPSWISRKISYMRRNLRDAKKRELGQGCASYRSELSRLLEHTCCKCGIMGPVVGEEDFVMKGGWTYEGGDEAWFCHKCSEESPDFEEIEARLSSTTEKLKGPKDSQLCDVKVVRCSQSGRLTVAPTCLTEDRLDVVQAEPSLSTLVLVPYDSSAIRGISKWCDEVIKDRPELQECAQDLLKRPFLTNFNATFSCLYRHLLANIKHSMGKVFVGLSKVARGQVVTRNPNITNARKVNPNHEQTIGPAMRDQCGWSYPRQQQKTMESEARQNVNGKVKIHMRGTILKDFEDEELNRILLEGCQKFVNENITTIEDLKGDPNVESFLIKMSPIIVTYIRNKAKLFVKNIVAPNFSNYDLELDIDDRKLQIELRGVLYAEGFDEVNKTLAAEPEARLIPEVAARVALEEGTFPTVTLNWANLSASYNLDELRSKEIVKVARACQIGKAASPLSLLNLWTPVDWSPSEREKALRFRAEQLSIRRQIGEDVGEAIVEITQLLHEEGLNEELVTENLGVEVIVSVRRSLVERCPDLPPHSLNALVWYHLLLLRTGGSGEWTLKRSCGETLVMAYHPVLLEGLQQEMEVVVSLDRDGKNKTPAHDQPSDLIMAGFAWKEISILKFLHGLEKSEELASQTTVGVVISQQEEINFNESCERDEECDEVYLNSVGESYIIGNGDLRKQYQNRPAAVETMTFAQFFVDYYRKQVHQQVVINPESGVGKESEHMIVGGQLRAPTCIKLSNGVIMNKRKGQSKPVPMFLKQNTLDNLGERLLFLPWSNLDELHQRLSEDEEEKLKQNRLQLFPTAIFPGLSGRT